jgi:nucleotide-binding universal stress UspA family protein
VTSPGLPTASDAYELERRARAYNLAPDAWSVVHDVDVTRGLLQHAARHDNPLLVMATTARQPWSSSMFGSVPYDVLRDTDRPVLLVGPGVPSSYSPARTTLVACLDAGERAERAVAPVLAWQRTFDAHAPSLAEVIGALEPRTAAQRRLDSFAGLLAAQGIHPQVEVLAGDDPVAALEAHADRFEGPVFVATSARYTDGRLHWHSTTRDLLHRASRPVLVVPARPAFIPIPAAPALDPTVEHVAFHDITVPATQPAILAMERRGPDG